MNGRGVFSSKKMGRLMATFEPRRLRMLAVSVLSWIGVSHREQSGPMALDLTGSERARS